MRYAVILAGGSGTRLWPASRRARPKQLLGLGPRGESLIAGAVRRGRLVTGDDARVVIVTAEEQVAATREVMPGVELIAEPVGRNTAAAIALAAATLVARDPDAVLVILPADQHVADEAQLARLLAQLCDAAEATDAIGLVGITPTRAETGFGYLEVDGSAPPANVVRFVEKPDAPTAQRYLESGRYLWNAGMFVATARRLLAELAARLPATAAAARAIAAGGDAGALYAPLPKISIDHAVMEHAANVVAVPAAVGWDDVGSWAALPAVHGTDAHGNTLVGDAIVIGGAGNIVMADGGAVIATVGLSDIVVVKSGDAILVMRKDAAQDVRQVVDALAARALDRVL